MEGGCLCGRVRFVLDGPARNAGYCHCRMCRRATGAPVAALGTWPLEGVRWRGEPAWRRSSALAERAFCPACGSAIGMRMTAKPDEIDLMLGLLDAPGAVRPASHIWWAERVPWFALMDDLPKYDNGGPAGPGVDEA